MTSRGNGNFMVRHYDWIAAGVAVLALFGAVGFYVLSLGHDADASARAAVAAIDRRKPASCGVEKTDLAPYAAILRQAKTPLLVAEVDGSRESFLASERRIKCCHCEAVMPSGLAECPKCKTSLVVVNEVDEEAKKVARWKARYGVDPDDGDADGDGFTNREEYEAQTDPTDPKDHPDYVDSLRLTLPLKETYVPFVLTKATQIPAGWRCEFFDPRRKDDYGRLGCTFTAVVGEEILIPKREAMGAVKHVSTGYVLKGFEKKEELRAITSGSAMKRAVDVSVATLERKSDGKGVKLVVQSNRKKVRLSPVDVQATLVYERRGTKTFEVVAGDEIDLNGSKYRIASVRTLPKGAEVVVESVSTGSSQTLKTLE